MLFYAISVALFAIGATAIDVPAAASHPADRDVSAYSPSRSGSGPNLTYKDFQQRISYNDKIWYSDNKYGSIQEIGSLSSRVGWRLKGDDDSAVVLRVCFPGRRFSLCALTQSSITLLMVPLRTSVCYFQFRKFYGSLTRFAENKGYWVLRQYSSIYTAYNNVTSKSTETNSPVDDAVISVWNSTAIPYVPVTNVQSSVVLTTDEYCYGLYPWFPANRGANVSFAAELTYKNDSKVTLNGPVWDAALGTTKFQFNIEPDVVMVNVTASNSTYHEWAGTLWYTEGPTGAAVKYGPGPNCKHALLMITSS
jgi:hypothetical protein